MEDVLLRFPHISGQILEKLDNESLTKCREVSRIWKKVIDEKKIPWIRIIDLPKVNLYGNTYLHIAAKNGQTDMFEEILFKGEDKNAKNYDGFTPLHFASLHGHYPITKVIIDNSKDLDIDLNAKTYQRRTSFHLACMYGRMETAEILMKNSIEFDIDLNAKTIDGETALHHACR